MYAIYALIDPRDNTVHYIGQTSDVYARFKQHISGEGSFAKTAWLFDLHAANQMIIMETLELVGNYQEALERERYWIKHFEMLNAPLLNVRHRLLSERSRKVGNHARNESKLNRNLKLAQQFWAKGHRSCRDMATAFCDAGTPIGKDAAIRIIREMKNRQLI